MSPVLLCQHRSPPELGLPGWLYWSAKEWAEIAFAWPMLWCEQKNSLCPQATIIAPVSHVVYWLLFVLCLLHFGVYLLLESSGLEYLAGLGNMYTFGTHSHRCLHLGWLVCACCMPSTTGWPWTSSSCYRKHLHCWSLFLYINLVCWVLASISNRRYHKYTRNKSHFWFDQSHLNSYERKATLNRVSNPLGTNLSKNVMVRRPPSRGWLYVAPIACVSFPLLFVTPFCRLVRHLSVPFFLLSLALNMVVFYRVVA